MDLLLLLHKLIFVLLVLRQLIAVVVIIEVLFRQAVFFGFTLLPLEATVVHPVFVVLTLMFVELWIGLLWLLVIGLLVVVVLLLRG